MLLDIKTILLDIKKILLDIKSTDSCVTYSQGYLCLFPFDLVPSVTLFPSHRGPHLRENESQSHSYLPQ